MNVIYKIPVLGRMARFVGMLVRLPEIVKNNIAKINAMQEQIRQQAETLTELRAESTEIQAKIEQYQQKMQEQRTVTDQQIDTVRQECRNMLWNEETLKRLNVMLSVHPTIWGEEERLHISPLAAVFTCFFNTNSGEITVGDYTFAGSCVSILAGSHDMILNGLARRDAEFTQGCDITIGKGVWLGSDCTILGPCTIEDNAVIAAGAVVIPGTVVPANTVYGGVPASRIREIETDPAVYWKHIADAVERENDILFVEGWSEKRFIEYGGSLVRGHWFATKGAYIYTKREKLHLLFHKESDDSVEVILRQGEKQEYVKLEQMDLEYEFTIDQKQEGLHRIEIVLDTDKVPKLFVAAIVG